MRKNWSSEGARKRFARELAELEADLAKLARELHALQRRNETKLKELSEGAEGTQDTTV